MDTFKSETRILNVQHVSRRLFGLFTIAVITIRMFMMIDKIPVSP